ncbi:AraC family transcriptional regulator [Leeia sp.]|uniref:AraC family transcriptional regulator n=1 Tax=Leeia sp. TaxID=2884678 RepID=UPI0035B0D039
MDPAFADDYDQRPMTLHTVSLTAKLLQAQGIAVSALLTGSRVSESDLQTPAAMITQGQELTIFANALRLSQDTAIGLRIGRNMHVSSYGALGYAMLVSPTLRDALRCALDFPGLLGSFFELNLHEDGELAALVAGPHHARAALYPLNADMCLASLWAIIGDVLGRATVASAVSLRFPRPEHASAYIPCFGVMPVFEAACDAVWFPREWLSQPLPLAEPVSHYMAVQQCERLQQEWQQTQGSRLLARVLHLLRSNPAHYGQLDVLAKSLCMSERTLRRRLLAEGVHFQQVLDRVRCQMAVDYLERTRLPIAEVAERLGYSETASFRHAFRRWTGRCPSDWRSAPPAHAATQ